MASATAQVIFQIRFQQTSRIDSIEQVMRKTAKPQPNSTEPATTSRSKV